MKKIIITYSLLLNPLLYSSAQIITTIAGNGTAAYTGNGGPATDAELNYPESVAIDDSGNVFEGELYNYVVRKINSSGLITLYAGNSYPGYYGDGGPATLAEMQEPSGLAFDTANNLYICDYINQRIRFVNAKTGIITTIAGNGVLGYSGDGGPATSAELQEPEDMTLDDSGNVYIADTYNYCIRKVSVKNGYISTIIGNTVQGYTGDGGPASLAEIDHTEKINSDAKGNLYISDAGNFRIRYVSASTGIITTIAGNGVAGSSGDGGPATSAELSYNLGIAHDITGNVYFADFNDQNVRMVNISTRIITEVAGNGIAGFSGDGGPATLAELSDPDGIAFNKTGDLFITDTHDSHIRKVTSLFTGSPEITNPTEVNVFPNPSNGIFTIQSLVISGQRSVEVYNVIGETVYTKSNIQNSTSKIDLSAQPNGVYFYRVESETDKIIGEGKVVVQK